MISTKPTSITTYFYDVCVEGPFRKSDWGLEAYHFFLVRSRCSLSGWVKSEPMVLHLMVLHLMLKSSVILNWRMQLRVILIGFTAADFLPHDDRNRPYFIIGNDAFALQTLMMKPIGRRSLSVLQRIFNYRLSRARHIMENAFGILGNRFQCLLSILPQDPDTVGSIVLSCICTTIWECGTLLYVVGGNQATERVPEVILPFSCRSGWLAEQHLYY